MKIDLKKQKAMASIAEQGKKDSAGLLALGFTAAGLRA